jgi:hypothetical protein
MSDTKIADELNLKAAENAAEVARIDLEIKKAQLEEIKAQAEERKYNLADLKHRLAEREIKEKQVTEDRAAVGRTIAQQEATDTARWKVCSHRKGGIVKPRDLRVLSIGGNSQQYSVFKHQMINGDIWIRCSRCGKTWAPPQKERFYFDKFGREVGERNGTFDEERFRKAWVEYQTAIEFPTNNTMSTSVQARFSKFNAETGAWEDAAKEYARDLAYTNLR